MNSLLSPEVWNNDNYNRIARAIKFMREHHLNHPTLETVARYTGLSESHFQRLFTRWADISPKRFSQYLTLEYAKSNITRTNNLLALSLDVGLSGPGRLHDLFVNLEAMSPGEYKRGGAGLEIHYGIHETPFGDALLAITPRGICNLHFLSCSDERAAEQILRRSWPNAEIRYTPSLTRQLNERIFNAARFEEQKPLTLSLKGTNFQIQVWRALLKVPFGGITTYSTIGEMIGRPLAARAVGNAVANNPIGYLIPCHRVILESGELGGYCWSSERKAAILGWEASRTNLEI
ncbi:MAG: Bifunctional transcriptional activator/DNA repair enzyme Ada (plasmid) [Chroococcopsis gigantea SAG 12.99]|jgi:AraC family transcriptional regulator of adaptative response/methylated-DNA-[protein]-cysteine methyltransferase|nr:Bifunctional transcriptional activator/DNA repair enzyme Ada [Chroococcopsis gigantea SAG 12.99]